MNKKIFILLFFLFVLISMSAVSAVDADGNNDMIVSSADAEALAIENDVNAIDDLSKNVADGGDEVLANDSASVAVGKNKEILQKPNSDDVLGEDTTNTWYVNASATGGDGKSEATAFQTLKVALDVANDEDTIMIASGTFETASYTISLKNSGTPTVLNIYMIYPGEYNPSFTVDIGGRVKNKMTGDTIKKGSVKLYLDGENVKNITVDADDGSISDSFGSLDVGNYTVKVVYHDDTGEFMDCEWNRSFEIKQATTEITINNTSIELIIGNSTIIEAVLSPSGAGNLNYSSNDTSVAVVNENGVVTAVGEGNAYITVAFAGNEKYTAASKNITVNVSLNDASVSVDDDTMDLFIGQEIGIDAYPNPDTLNVTFKSNNESVATVDANGKVTAIGLGNTTITVSVGGDGVYALNSTTVTVNVGKITTEIIVVNTTVDMNVGDNVIVNATLIPDGAGELDFTSSDVSVVTVNGIGELTAVGEGTANITVAFYGNEKYDAAVSKTVTVTVSKVPTEISVATPVLDLNVRDEFVTGATLTPADAGNLTYTVSDPSVVKVEDGMIIALAEGSAVITVSFDGDNKYVAAESKTINVSVSMAEAKINITVPDYVFAGDDVTVNVNIENATGSVELYIDDTFIDLKELDENSTAVFVIENITVNNNYFTVIYLGDDKFNKGFMNAEIVVLKQFPEISVDCPDYAFAGEDVNITIHVENATGLVILNLDDTSVNAGILDENSTLTFVIKNVTAGNHCFTIIYSGDDKYNDEVMNKAIVILKDFAEISVDAPSTAIVGDDINVTVNVKNATGIVKLNLDGAFVDVGNLDENGTITFAVNDIAAGEHYFTVTYGGNGKYHEESRIIGISVAKKTAEANITLPVDFKVDEEANVTVDIPGATGNVSVIVDGVETVAALDENGTAVVPMNMTPGEHSVVVVYLGDETYAPAVKSTTTNVATLTSQFQNLTLNGDLVLTGVLVNSMGDVIPNATIAYTIGAKKGTLTTGADGSFTLVAENNAVLSIDYAGTSDVAGTNIDITIQNIAPSRLSSEFNVTEGISIKTYAVDTPAGEVGQTTSFKLTDSNGKPIANAAVKFAYKTVILNRTTDENGIVFIGINTQVAQEALCAMSYLGDEKYNATFVAFSFDIQKKPITITASSKTYKASAKTKKYTVTIKTEKCNSKDGKVYLSAGKKITMKINGKTYTAKTNSNGQATFKISINKKGKYSASVKFAGDKTYASASKSVKITIK